MVRAVLGYVKRFFSLRVAIRGKRDFVLGVPKSFYEYASESQAVAENCAVS